MKTCVSAVLIAAVVAALVAGAGPARSDEAVGYLAVYPDETAGSCEFVPNATSMAYVVLTHSIPVQELTFTAPKPSFIGTIIYESSPFATTGDSQTGITVDLGMCMSAPVTVLSIYHLGVGSTSGCATWPVGENPGFGDFTFDLVDCDGVTRQGHSAVLASPTTEGVCCPTDLWLTPYDPYPANGATDVPTNVILSWTLPEEAGGEWVWFTDQPYYPGYWCSTREDYFTTYDPGELQPHTTYYWQIGLEWNSCYSGVSGGRWSFTTGDGPVTTEETTWGRIKALYR
jgi:hypothetical protein